MRITFPPMRTCSGLFFLALCSGVRAQTPLTRAPWGVYSKEVQVYVGAVDTGKRASDIACSGASLWAIGVTPTGGGNLDMFSLDLPADRMYRAGNCVRDFQCEPWSERMPASFPATALPVQAVKVAVDSSGTPWVLTAQGQIWKRNPDPSIRWDLKKMAPIYAPGDPPEIPLEPTYTAIASADANVWAVGVGGGVSYPAGYGGVFYAGADGQFRRLPGPDGNQGVKDLTIDYGPARILGPIGNVVWASTPNSKQWLPTLLTEVAPTVYVTGANGKRYRLGTGNLWTEIVPPANLVPAPAGYSKTVFCGGVPWMINQSTGNVWMGYRHSVATGRM